MIRFRKNSRRVVALSLLAFACVLAATLSGCGRETDDRAATTASVAAPAVDPRFVSAENLLAEFNRLTTTDPIDPVATLALYYAETPLQTELLSVSRTMTPMYALNDAFQQRYKQPIDPAMPKAFVAKVNGPARITQNQGDRATATYKDWDGTSETLQLVKYNGRWWVSGYTVEQHPNIKALQEDERTFIMITMRAMGAVAPDLTARINAGEFASVTSARTALQMAAAAEIQKNPADAQRIREIVQRNPKLTEAARRAAGQ